MIVSALQMRWKRALHIADADIQHLSGSKYLVRSQAVPGGAFYQVEVHFTKEGQLKSASCSCPDFTKDVHPLATPMLRNVRVCKHVLAAARVAKE